MASGLHSTYIQMVHTAVPVNLTVTWWTYGTYVTTVTFTAPLCDGKVDKPYQYGPRGSDQNYGELRSVRDARTGIHLRRRARLPDLLQGHSKNTWAANWSIRAPGGSSMIIYSQFMKSIRPEVISTL